MSSILSHDCNKAPNDHTKEQFMEDDIVISGISGRFPESSNVEEFRNNLFNAIDMVNDEPRRWPTGMYNLPARMGKIKDEDLQNFDRLFFGVHQKQTEAMDPGARMLLEATHEAIIDSGYNPQDLRGSCTGVYVGVAASEMEEYWVRNPYLNNDYVLSGFLTNMFANRISFLFDFCGPSYAVDTACASSIYALAHAFQDLRAGRCDAAIVAGSHILLNPSYTLFFKKLNMLSPDGACKAFDASANGYVRADGCVVIFLQKAKNARRVYSTILNVGTNVDGFKTQGVHSPSGLMQKRLIEETFNGTNLNPHDVTYIEAHGTGTPVGDPQEVNSICDFFCNNRQTPILIGSTKSNMGHSEPASGLCAIVKLLIAMEEGVIPGNLHFCKPNPNLHGILDGRIKVVDKNTPWNGGIVALNSFGFGGANGHIIMKSNPREKKNRIFANFPRLAVVSGRTVEAVEVLLKDIVNHAEDEEYMALLNEIHTKNIPLHFYRGYTIMEKDEEPVREVIEIDDSNRPIWFIYSGVGSQWAHMAKEMMQLDVFSRSINRCAKALLPLGLDLIETVTNADELDVLETAVAIISIQIALTDVLAHLGIIPDGLIGHSVGELGCAYTDGCFTAEQAVLTAYWRGRSILDINTPPGMMASVGLTSEECLKRLPEDVTIACYNSHDNLTITGLTESVKKFVGVLAEEGIFARAVESAGIALHSKYLNDAGPKLMNLLNNIIPQPVKRSEKWVSTTIPENELDSPVAKTCSPAYVMQNLLSPVYFYEATQKIPKNAICIEIAPHGILQAILRRSLEKDVTNLSLLKRNNENNRQFFLSNIGKLYAAGAQPNISKLYQPVSFPVGRGTPMLNSKIRWDHTQKYAIPNLLSNTNSMDSTVEINLANEEDAFLGGHAIDGRVMFPAAGYIVHAWRQFAKVKGLAFGKFPVMLDNFVVHRATILTPNVTVKFGITFLAGSGKFEICEGDSIVASGIIRIPENIDNEQSQLEPIIKSDGLSMDINDVYKEFRIRGYDLNGQFRCIVESDKKVNCSKVKWIDGNWINFLDSLVQFCTLNTDVRELYVPLSIRKVTINPEKHQKLIEKFKTDVEEVHLPAYKYRNLNVLTAGGVEIYGMEGTILEKRQSTQNQATMERYTFVPNFNNYKLSKNLDSTKEMAITCAVHIMIENSKGSYKFKISEVLLSEAPENILSKMVQSAIENEPILSSVVSIVTTNTTPELEEQTNDTEIHVVVQNIIEGPIDSDCHLCMASDVLVHPDAEVILQNLIKSIKGDGFILLEELSNTNGDELFTKLNLLIVSSQVSSNKRYILLRPTFDIKSQQVQVINVTEKNFDWLKDLKLALRTATSDSTLVYIVCQGEELFGAVGLMNCIKNETGGKFARLIFIQDTNAPEFSIYNPFYEQQLQKNLIVNVLRNNVWGSYRHLKLEYEPKEVEHAYVNTLMKGDLSSLKWIEGPLSTNRLDLEDDNFELCTVYYAPLNFRDVMLASGKLPSNALVDDRVHEECNLGIEFSGRDSQGNRIIAALQSVCFASTSVVPKICIMRIPDSWTLEQASTIPLVYVTAYYGLVVRGNMKKGETILIHSGSGGVGLAAINIALDAGLTVFTTVGSKEKREFIRKTFPQLPERNIGNSRDCSFQQLVMEETNGKGVDLVLNSLSGEKLQASVLCLRENGRFLEIGKFDLSSNNPLGMSVFIKNTSFHGIHIDRILSSGIETVRRVFNLLADGIKSGVVKPLPITVYDAKDVEQAFRFMASGKHIGKVVIKVRDEEEQKHFMPPMKLISTIPRTYLLKRKSYVIVGGLGGFGLELIHWLISRGACNIVASSRNGIKTGYQTFMMQRWQEKGVNVVVHQNDVTTLNGVQQLLMEASKLGAVGGIFNLAAVLRDGILEDQSEDNFRTVCLPKVHVTKYLDAASREFCPELDYFVCFSSISSGRGNVGQTNYGLANSAMERICEARQVAGYPGTAIQWGAIGDTGMVFEFGNNDTILGGTKPQKIASCLQTLDTFLQQPFPVLASMVVANKKVEKSGQLSIVDIIANIFGIKDIKNIKPSLTFVDQGIDSLMGMEIKQILERNFDIVMNEQEIRQLTFEKIKELGLKKGTKINSVVESNQ